MAGNGNKQNEKTYKLLEHYNKKRAAVNNIHAPDEKDRKVTHQELYDFVTAKRTASYAVSGLCKRVAERLGRLSEEELGALYDKIKKPEAPKPEAPEPDAGKRGRNRQAQGKKPLTREDFIRNLKTGARPGMLFNADNFGLGMGDLLKAYEDAMGPAVTEELVSLPDPVAPMDPKFPNKNHRPLHDTVEAAKNRLTKGLSAQEAKPIQELMAEVDRCLEVADPAAQNYVHMTYTGQITDGDRTVDYENVLNNRSGNITKEGFDLLAGGRFRDKVRSVVKRDNTFSFEIGETDRLNGPLSEEDRRVLAEESKNPDAGLSQDTLNAVDEIEKQFDKLDYLSGGAAPMRYAEIQLRPSETGDEAVYGSEDGGKLYAFAPLHVARQALVNALETGSEEEIRRRVENYREKERIFQSMMDTIHSEKLSQEPISSANVESTRDAVTTIPGQYTLDYMGHHKLNALYINYGYAKNTNNSMKELARDPYGAMMKAAKTYADAAGPDAKTPNIGANLMLCMRAYPNSAESSIMGTWRFSLEGGMGRGILGVAGLEKDPQRRAKYLARANLATLAATKQIEDVMLKRTEVLDRVLTGKAKDSRAKRQAIYRNAAIRPERGPEAFSMSKIVDEFSKTGAQAEDWKRNLDTEFFANGSSMYVDLKELAGRNKKLLADARREQIRSGSYDTHFNPDEYLLSAFQQQSRLLEKTAERPVKPDGWEELRESVLKTHELAEDPDVRASLALGAELVKDKDFLSLLKTDKGDQIQSGDSAEYRSMREKLDEVRDAVSALKTGDPEKLNALYGHSMIDSIAEAKSSAFDYYRLKLKDGTKTSFWYKSGLKRAQEGRKVFQTLQKFQKEHGLLSPAQERWENARMTLLEHRSDPNWPKEDRDRTLCELVYTRSILDAGIPAEHQSSLLEAGRVERGYKKIKTELLNRFEERGAMNELMEEAIQDNKEFRRRINPLATSWHNAYEKQMTPRRLEAERQRLRRNYAMTIACKELQITSNFPSFTEKNPDVAKRADEILKRPLFRETMERIMAGKVLATLQRENDGTLSGNSGDRESQYFKVSQTIRYERKCAALAVDNMYKLQNREPSDEVRSRDVETLYQNREFRQACGNLLDRANGEKIMTMIDDLDKPQIRNRTVEQLSEIAGKAARQAREAEARREQELRIQNAPLIQEENIQNDAEPLQLQGDAPRKGGANRFTELFEPNEGNQPGQEKPEDQIIYDKDGNVVYEPEKPALQKGFLKEIIESVNAPGQPERPKEVGFGPGMSNH